jgi:hypothetical protein
MVQNKKREKGLIMTKRNDNRNSAIRYSFASYDEYSAWNSENIMAAAEYEAAKVRLAAEHPDRDYVSRTKPLADYDEFYATPSYRMNYLEGKWERN